jgi:hypothetical protein
MKDAIKRSSEVIRGHQRFSECSSPDDGKGTVEPAEAIEAHQKPSEMSSETQ